MVTIFIHDTNLNITDLGIERHLPRVMVENIPIAMNVADDAPKSLDLEVSRLWNIDFMMHHIQYLNPPWLSPSWNSLVNKSYLWELATSHEYRHT